MLNKMNIRSRVIFYVIIQLVLLTLILATVSIVRMNNMTRNITMLIFREKLIGDLNSANMYISNYYGSLTFENYTLVDKDGDSIENNFDLVDAMYEEMNVYATIFVKQGVEFKRISTSIRAQNNQRIVGTFLDSENSLFSAKASLLRGERFIDKILIDGKMYLAGYMPLKTDNMDVYGAVFVGIPMSRINDQISNETSKTICILIMLSLLMIVIFIFFLYKAIKKALSNPIRKTISILKGFAEDKTDLKKRLVIDNDDEMGELVYYFNKILDKIYNIVELIVKNASNVHERSINLTNTANQMVKNSINMNDRSLILSTSTDEISLNSIKITTLADSSSISVDSVATSSEKLSTLINNLAAITEQTNLTVASTMETINKFENTIMETGNNVLFLIEDIHKMTESIEKTNLSFNNLTENSKIIFDMANNVNVEAESAVLQTNELNNITKKFISTAKSIQRISENSNMLVFNMSLELARLGDSGRGFTTMINEFKETNNKSIDKVATIIEQMNHLKKVSLNLKKIMDNIIENQKIISSAVLSCINEKDVTTEEIVLSQGALSLQASNVDIKIKILVDYAKNIISYINQAVGVFDSITENSYDSAQASNEITNNSMMANRNVLEIKTISNEIKNNVEMMTQNMILMKNEIDTTITHAASTKKAADDLNQIANELKKHTDIFSL